MSMPSFHPNRLRRRVNAKMVNAIKVEKTMNEVEFLASEPRAPTNTPKFSHSPNSAFSKPRKLTEIPNNGLQDFQFPSRRHLALQRPFQTNYFDEIDNRRSIHHILPRQELIDYTQFPNIPDINAATINSNSSYCEPNGNNIQDQNILAFPRPFQTNYYDEIANTRNIHHILPRQELIQYTQFPNIPDTNAATINSHSSCEPNESNIQDPNIHTRIQLCDRCRKHPVVCSEADSDSGEKGLERESEEPEPEIERRSKQVFFSDSGENGSEHESEPEPEIERRSTQVFFVEKILKKRVVLGEEQYFVKWMGYNKNFNSWEPRRSFVHDALVENYEKKMQNKRNARRLENRKKRTQNISNLGGF